MNSPKCSDEDYINFVIATPRVVTATEAARVQPEGAESPRHDAFTRLLERLEPDPEALWREAETQIDRSGGILVLDDSTLDKPYSRRNDLVYRHWSGKHKEVVSGINLIICCGRTATGQCRVITAFSIKIRMEKLRTTISRRC